ncbi:MAG: hypothetical protein ACRCXQ_09445 [Vagococcus fluvialis]
MFDFNKLDSYKVAIDDGFILEGQDEIVINGMFVEIQLFKKELYGYVITGLAHDTYVINLEEKDWNTFKTKVTDFFLGVEDK